MKFAQVKIFRQYMEGSVTQKYLVQSFMSQYVFAFLAYGISTLSCESYPDKLF